MFRFEVVFGELKHPDYVAERLLDLTGTVNRDKWADFGPGALFVISVEGKMYVDADACATKYYAYLYCAVDVSGTAHKIRDIEVYEMSPFAWLPEPVSQGWIPEETIHVVIL